MWGKGKGGGVQLSFTSELNQTFGSSLASMAIGRPVLSTDNLPHQTDSPNGKILLPPRQFQYFNSPLILLMFALTAVARVSGDGLAAAFGVRPWFRWLWHPL